MLRNKKKNKLKFLMFVMTTIVILMVVLVLNMGKRDVGISEDWDNYMVIGKENVFVVYGEKLAVQVPFEINMNKEKTLGDIAQTKNYEEVVRSLNEILPEKVENFKAISKGNIEIDAKSMRQIPEISMNEKRYVLTSSLNSMFLELYYETTDASGDNIIIDVLNANGRSGYAREAGEKLANTFNIKYNAANFDTNEQYSYIQNKDLSEEKLREIVMELDEKYFKIKDDGALPTLANAVVVLGREQEEILGINVYAGGNTGENTAKQLERVGYKRVVGKQSTGNLDNSFVEYNKDDYYTAYKLADRLGIKNMVENKELKEEINIFIK